MQTVYAKQSALFAVFFLISSLSCIAFENGSCMNPDGSYDVPLILFDHLLSMASPNGFQPRCYGVSRLSIQQASAQFESYLMSYIPECAQPTVKISQEDLGLLMLSFDENYRGNMQQSWFKQRKAEIAGFNPSYIFSIEDDCGPDEIANWMLGQDY